jgi:hypothetical protein
LPKLTAFVPFLAGWSKDSPHTFALVSGVLPPAVSGFFAFFLPIIMRRLSKYMGAVTRSYMDRAVVARYFAFLVISQLVIFTLVGVIFSGRFAIVFSALGSNDCILCPVRVKDVIVQIGSHTSFQDIWDNFYCKPLSRS